ncbi:MAG: uroporphyrinogen-III C-methyltransferase [Methylophaga sp.]|nr:uroporphyrinogen-III C-methyltransferase [Methylophaga sp.]
MDNNSPSSEQNPKTKPANVKPNWPRLRRNIAGLVVFLVVLVPALLALWWSYQQQQNLDGLNQQVTSLTTLERDIATLNRARQRSELTLQQLSDAQIQQAQAIADLQQREPLTDKAIRLRWTLKEIDYLLQLANQRATLANDASGARQALQLADEKLRDLNDYRLQDLRQQIADEQLLLDAVATADITGIAADLQSAINAIDALRVVKGPKQFAADPMADTGVDLSSRAGWQNALSDIWQQIRSLVVIRQHEDATQAVLIPEQRYFLYQNLRLKLETARFALLSGKQSIYDSSLQTSIDWLKTYFVGEQRDAMLASLESLKFEQIEVALPDITGSLRWLQDFEP